MIFQNGRNSFIIIGERKYRRLLVGGSCPQGGNYLIHLQTVLTARAALSSGCTLGSETSETPKAQAPSDDASIENCWCQTMC